jgi:hypothetical protein
VTSATADAFSFDRPFGDGPRSDEVQWSFLSESLCMSWSDTFRDRHYEPGYVYVAGSLSNRILKIGTTITVTYAVKKIGFEGTGTAISMTGRSSITSGSRSVERPNMTRTVDYVDTEAYVCITRMEARRRDANL